MEIGLHNYEAFFLDYKEGNLSAGQEKELFLFLEQNPHLYEELHAFENIALDDLAAAEMFQDKDILKKTDYKSTDLVAYTEGILDENSKKEIDALAAQNSALKKELSLYQSTRLSADLSLKFKNKARLKRGGVLISLQKNYDYVRVAAAVLLMIGLFFVILQLNDGSKQVAVGSWQLAEGIQKSKVRSQNLAEGSQKLKVKSQRSEEDNKQLAVSSWQLAEGNQKSKVKNHKSEENNKQLAVSNGNKVKVQKKNNENVKQIVPQPQNEAFVKNQVKINKQPENNATPVNESAVEEIIAVKNNASVETASGSYFNSLSGDKDDMPVTASVNTGKKTFFQKLVKAAKKANSLGVKKINADEENDSNTLSIGSFVVTENTSN
jgi:hypothetical protein